MIQRTRTKHTRKRRAFTQRPFPISLTPFHKGVANRRIQQRRRHDTTPRRPLSNRPHKLHIPPPGLFGQVSVISLLVLSPQDPLRWALVGAPCSFPRPPRRAEGASGGTGSPGKRVAKRSRVSRRKRRAWRGSSRGGPLSPCLVVLRRGGSQEGREIEIPSLLGLFLVTFCRSKKLPAPRGGTPLPVGKVPRPQANPPYQLTL